MKFESETGLAITYTIEEFLEDCEALLGNRPEGYERGDEEDAFYTKIGQVADHMKAKYSSKEDWMFRSSRFGVALNYLSENADAFDQGDYAVFGSDEVGGLVAEHVLRALHSVFMAESLPSGKPDPEDVMKLADSLKDG